jgi:hypothetical protein
LSKETGAPVQPYIRNALDQSLRKKNDCQAVTDVGSS